MVKVAREVGPQLLDGLFAPLTEVLLFIRTTPEIAARDCAAWMKGLDCKVRVYRGPARLPETLHALEPLNISTTSRYAFLPTQNPEWTAMWINDANGNEPTGTFSMLMKRLAVEGVTVTYGLNVQPPSGVEARELDSPEKLGGRVFSVDGIAPDGTRFSRSIYLCRQSGRRWLFDASGEPLPFENLEAYTSKRLLDRFTPEMLVQYSAAMGLRPFDDDFYTGPSVMVDVTNPRIPKGSPKFTLQQARDRLGYGKLFPGEEATQ